MGRFASVTRSSSFYLPRMGQFSVPRDVKRLDLLPRKERPRVLRPRKTPSFQTSEEAASPANLIASILTLVGLACSSCRPPSDPNPIWVQLPSSQNTGSRRGPLPCTPLRPG